ncbi:MAG TPA: hypothetical protein VLF67_02270 [Candidatus Saccharimonas sp.]|nr:hypothetical protein [Candidatus Saccharimonas sp.]
MGSDNQNGRYINHQNASDLGSWKSDRRIRLDEDYNIIHGLQITLSHFYYGRRTMRDLRFNFTPFSPAIDRQLEHVDTVMASRLGIKPYEYVLGRALCLAADVDWADQSDATTHLQALQAKVALWADYTLPAPSTEDIEDFGEFFRRAGECFFKLAAQPETW